MENQPSSSSSSSSMKMQFLLLEQVQFLKVKDDTLLQWELLDVFDAEEVEEQWEKGIDEVDDIDGFGYRDSSSVSSPNYDPIEEIGNFLPHVDVRVHVVIDRVDDADGYDEHVNDHDHDGDGDGDDHDHDGDDHDGDDDYGYDLNDELIPWDIVNKFGRQRMRKLGKRAFPKMNNSKRNPNLFIRPGCVHGKHGLGLKHTY